jgi:hypothetical protein
MLTLLLAATTAVSAADQRYVKPAAKHATVILWESSAGHSDCTDGIEVGACEAATVGELARGVPLHLQGDARECAPDHVRVTVLSGKHEGKSGCLEPDLMSTSPDKKQ